MVLQCLEIRSSQAFVFSTQSLSGGDDDAHGNQTVMEMSFEEGNAEWEITRYGEWQTMRSTCDDFSLGDGTLIF
jgi:hypothetical protein